MTDEEKDSLFNEWFMDVLWTLRTCLLRDVFRDSKEELRRNFMLRKPFEGMENKE